MLHWFKSNGNLGKQAILPSSRVASGRVCACSLCSRLINSFTFQGVHFNNLVLVLCIMLDMPESWSVKFTLLAELYLTVLNLYLDERRGVQGNTSRRSREFPRAQPKGTPETECWYFPVLPYLRYGHYPIFKSDEALPIAIASAVQSSSNV